MKNLLNRTWFRAFVVSFLVCVVSVGLAACVLVPGPAGVNGTPGQVFDYTGYLKYLWEHNLVDHDDYDDNENVFLVKYPQEYLKGDTGDTGNDSPMSWTETAKTAVQSAVDVFAQYKTGNYVMKNGVLVEDIAFSQAGSGVIYQLNQSTGDAFIITNYHVVSSYYSNSLTTANDIWINIYGLPSVCIPATILGGSPDYDIAILQVKGSDFISILNGSTITKSTKDKVSEFLASSIYQVQAVKIPSDWTNGTTPSIGGTEGKFWSPDVGTNVIAVGNPLGDGMSVTEGIISVANEIVYLERLDKLKGPNSEVSNGAYLDPNRVMRISAAINPGNSGGGLFNQNGKLVGIIQARMYWAGNNNDYPVDIMAYAIPLDIVVRIADQIVSRKDEYSVEKQQISLGKYTYTCTFGVSGVESLIYPETVNVTSPGKFGTDNLAKYAIVDTITIGYKGGDDESEDVTTTYTIEHLYQIDELMIEAFQKTIVTIQLK